MPQIFYKSTPDMIQTSQDQSQIQQLNNATFEQLVLD